MSEQETPAVQEATPAPAPATRTRKARAQASTPARGKGNATRKGSAKAAPKARAARQPIPAGMTRSRGALIPVSNGRCGFAGSGGQCANPGRWPLQVGKARVLSCSTHQRAVGRGATPKIVAPLRGRAAKAPAAAQA